MAARAAKAKEAGYNRTTELSLYEDDDVKDAPAAVLARLNDLRFLMLEQKRLLRCRLRFGPYEQLTGTADKVLLLFVSSIVPPETPDEWRHLFVYHRQKEDALVVHSTMSTSADTNQAYDYTIRANYNTYRKRAKQQGDANNYAAADSFLAGAIVDLMCMYERIDRVE